MMEGVLPPIPFQQRWLPMVLSILVVLLVTGGSFVTVAKMAPLTPGAMRQVSGGEGVAFALENFHITGNNSIEVYENTDSCCDGGLRLERINLHEPGSSSNGVTTGNIGDPITLDVGGSHNGVLVMELPNDKSNMEKNTFLIGGATDGTATDGIYFTDSGDGSFVRLGGLRMHHAQYAGGTRLSFSGTPNSDGGFRTGIAIELNGSLDFNDPTGGGFAFNGVHGAETYSGTDYDPSSWSFSGPLRWASIADGRPLVVNFQATNNAGELMIEWNPDLVSPTAGTLAVEQTWFQGQRYGEVVIEDIQVRNLQIKYNTNWDPVTSDLGGYTAKNF